MKKFTFLFFFALAVTVWFSNVALAQSITQRGNEPTASTSSTTLTINKPTGLAVGDVMLVNIVQGDNDGGQSISNNASRSGWTLVKGGSLGSSGNNDWWGTVLYKVADAADAAATNFAFTLDPIVNGDGALGTMLAFYNVNTTGGVGPDGTGTGPFDVAAGSLGTATSATLTAPGITTVTNSAAIVMFGMAGNNDLSFFSWTTTSPGGLTELYEDESNQGPDESVGAAWAIQTYAAATGNGTASISTSERNGALLVALKPANTYGAPNLWSTSGTDPIKAYTINPVTGAVLAGPVDVVSPSTSTAALGKNKANPNDADGYLYYLNRDNSLVLNGVVTVYSVKPDGTNNGSRGTIDMNGAGNNEDFSFVRLGFDATGKGWILAGTTSNLYIASFQGNGSAAISSVNTFGNSTLAISGGSGSDFQNGDLAISGNGTLYALANITDGSTYIYTLNSLTTPTTLTKKWTLVDGDGNNFIGSVNGVAWTQSGSMHFSTSAGIYFIDQATANSGAGTVQADLIASYSGLTDLASEAFPTQTTLPVSFANFNVVKQGSNALLSWTTKNELNTDHFDIERSYDGLHFEKVGSKQAAGITASDVDYNYTDPISVTAGNIYYRLKTVDIDDKSSLSKIVVLRLGNALVRSFTLYPNPVESNLKIQLDSQKDAVVTVRISSMLGQEVYRQTANLQKGTNIIVLAKGIESLKPGLYVTEIIDGNEKLVQKFIKR